VEEVYWEVNIREQTFYRWRRKYGRMEMVDARRFKELENENSELKKMLADEMLKSRVLKATLKKSGERLREAPGGEADGGGRDFPGAPSMPLPRTALLQLPTPRAGGAGRDPQTGQAHRVAEPEVSALRLPADPSLADAERMESRTQGCAEYPEAGRAWNQGSRPTPTAPGQFDGVTHTGNAAERSLELELRARPHR
jgi:putative transposase